MTKSCAHWMELSDRQLLGEELSPRELEFLRSHEFDCSQCSREAAMFRELRPAPLHVVPSEAEIQRVLRQANLDGFDEATVREPQAPPVVKRSKRWLAAGAAVALAAASVLLFLRARHTQPLASAAAAAATSTLRTSNATPPARAKEDSCGTIVEGIVLCLAAGTEIGQVQLNPPQRFVELKRGRAIASLAPQPKGSSFSIVTDAGDVTAVGTIFSVEVDAQRQVVARVTRGKVVVHGKRPGSDQALLAGQKVQLGESAASGLPLDEGARDLDLVARWSALGGDRVAHAEPEPAAEEGKAPELIESSAAGAQAPSKDELAAARQLRARGQFARAAALYRSIYTRSPHSETGRAALVSLASLQLSSLGDLRGALASFDAYLAGGSGALRQQAEYGRIRALHSLGRSAEELEASRKFIARYPNAPETRLLRASIAMKPTH